MTATGAGLALLATCCLVLAMAQAAEWRIEGLAGLVVVLALALWLSGEAASRTSMAAVSAWAADAERRLDLSALLLAEALLFGAQAIVMAQARTRAEAGRWWRWLGALPPPSLLLTLFFTHVAVMLSVDGVDFGLLSIGCAVLFPLAFVAGAWGLRRALPDVLMRSDLRLALHAVQVGAGIWLAGPRRLLLPTPFLPLSGRRGRCSRPSWRPPWAWDGFCSGDRFWNEDMEQLIQTLSWIAAALQVPVVVAILYLLLRGLIAVGGFYGRWTDRIRWKRRTEAPEGPGVPDAARTIEALSAAAARRLAPLQQAATALQQAPRDAAWHERVITGFELQTDRQLALYRTMTRIGPLLGLMGTLIPLGPALVALAAGDISLLARKMEVAFATTVVGLVIGAIGFLLHQAAQRWAMDDLSLLDFLSAKLREQP